MGANVILWGAATAAVAASNSYHSLLATRVLVGIFEAAVAPCLSLLVSQWYTKSEQAPRFCFWYAGLGTGQIVGGLQSFGFQHVANPPFAGWRIMFVTMGSITVLLGIFTFFFLAENPIKARFLSNAEKVALLNHVAENQTGVVNRHFKWSQVRELMADIQIWWLVVITILVSSPLASFDTPLTIIPDLHDQWSHQLVLDYPAEQLWLHNQAVGTAQLDERDNLHLFCRHQWHWREENGAPLGVDHCVDGARHPGCRLDVIHAQKSQV